VSGPDVQIPTVPGEACKLITIVMPDDGSDLQILKALRDNKNIIRADSTSCYASSALADKKTRPGKLPEPILARMVEVLVPHADADEIFRFVCDQTDPGQPEGAVVYQTDAPFCTPYELPEGVPDET
jgi:hypothetical protein